MSEADLIVVCFNIHEAVTHKDKELARIVRMSKKPTLLVVNKVHLHLSTNRDFG